MIKKITKIAALGDIHVGRSLHSFGNYEELFEMISGDADIFVMCGDLTDHGLPHEANQLATYLRKCTIPKVAVLGNHDYARGYQEEIVRILESEGVTILGEKVFEYHHVGIAGVKGFGGGFGQHMLTDFGESVIKQFVRETIDEAEQLEVSLDYIGKSDKKIVLLHYAPISQTAKGEPLEIYPFLGSSRLEEVIDRHKVTAVFHGHAHYGYYAGHTGKGTPVFNVSWPLMQKINVKKPYRILEV